MCWEMFSQPIQIILQSLPCEEFAHILMSSQHSKFLSSLRSDHHACLKSSHIQHHRLRLSESKLSQSSREITRKASSKLWWELIKSCHTTSSTRLSIHQAIQCSFSHQFPSQHHPLDISPALNRYYAIMMIMINSEQYNEKSSEVYRVWSSR